ncbi:nuclear fragile X mental retardation-interacting protein 2 isoform X1 [Salmo salar]|uniref:Nuclear fragile X mental retardation-interacting protein 2 isoform X1 n=2 Tax=Salmo salar TaxID=8030 RepID=A0A1S3T1H2_SALSA|nr:nuclear fragile X mental retardation-interacting protein 2 isoform X1 [Salmo salar]|eukprot:XP_014070444.1 PREDICTED: nuclear fragile X mental retardation-interacting protein 2-like isoform X1 [Salmo salar]
MDDRHDGRVSEGCLKHVDESRPGPPNTWVEDDQHQYEDAQTEKTGNGKINETPVEREDTPSAPIPVAALHYSSSRQLETSNLKPKPPGKLLAIHIKGSSNSHFKNRMNCKNDTPSELKTRDSKSKSITLPNGVVLLNPGLYANGYPSKPGPDSGGSGSESGYITPKKRWAQRSAMAEESVTAGQEKAVLQAVMVPNKHETEPHTPEAAKTAAGSLSPTSIKGVSPVAQAPVDQVVELQCRTSEEKAAAGSVKKLEDRLGKAKLTSNKEDSWTLFKPPPVFPVDNSSAKTVPKISYASKVKENLNKAAVQAAGDSLPPQSQVPTRLSQVPMSAVKTITSPSFTNGPLSGEGNSCPLPAPLFTSTVFTAPMPVSLARKWESEASLSSNGTDMSGTPSMTTRELRKASLLVYPLGTSNMQPALSSACHVDSLAAKTNPKALVDIFQNQWGLSFINEPSGGPGVGPAVVGQPARKGQIVEITFQGGGPAALPLQVSATSTLRTDKPLFPKAYEQDRLTISQAPSSVGKSGPPLAPGPDAGLGGQAPGPDPLRGEAGSRGAIMSSFKHPGTELPLASPAQPVSVLAKEPSHPKGCDPGSCWGAFDLKAAVIYHTKEIEYIQNLQKQDSKGVVFYDQSKDGPVQLSHD